MTETSLIHPLVERILREFPGMMYVQRAKKAKTAEHTFHDTETGAVYTTYTNGYVRRTIYTNYPGGREKIQMYQLNPYKVTKHETRHIDHMTGKPFIIYRTERLMIPTEKERLIKVLSSIDSFRKK